MTHSTILVTRESFLAMTGIIDTSSINPDVVAWVLQCGVLQPGSVLTVCGEHAEAHRLIEAVAMTANRSLVHMVLNPTTARDMKMSAIDFGLPAIYWRSSCDEDSQRESDVVLSIASNKVRVDKNRGGDLATF